MGKVAAATFGAWDLLAALLAAEPRLRLRCHLWRSVGGGGGGWSAAAAGAGVRAQCVALETGAASVPQAEVRGNNDWRRCRRQTEAAAAPYLQRCLSSWGSRALIFVWLFRRVRRARPAFCCDAA